MRYDSQFLIGLLQSYVQTCSQCQRGLSGACGWHSRCNELVSLVPAGGTFDEKATALHAVAGPSCKRQKNYYSLITTFDECFPKTTKPQKCAELGDVLYQLYTFIYDNLPRLPAALRAAFSAAGPAAAFRIIKKLDYYYLSNHADVLEIIRAYIPDYSRSEMFQGQMADLVRNLAFYSRKYTVFDVADDTPLGPETEQRPEPPSRPSIVIPSSPVKPSLQSNDEIRDFVIQKCCAIKDDPTCDCLVAKDRARKVWEFKGSVDTYAYFCLLIRRDLCHKVIPWKEIQHVVHYTGVTNNYIKKIASQIASGKHPVPSMPIAIKNAFKFSEDE